MHYTPWLRECVAAMVHLGWTVERFGMGAQWRARCGFPVYWIAAPYSDHVPPWPYGLHRTFHLAWRRRFGAPFDGQKIPEAECPPRSLPSGHPAAAWDWHGRWWEPGGLTRHKLERKRLEAREES